MHKQKTKDEYFVFTRGLDWESFSSGCQCLLWGGLTFEFKLMATCSPNSTSSNGQLSDCIELFGAMEIIKKNWVDKWFKVNKKRWVQGGESLYAVMNSRCFVVFPALLMEKICTCKWPFYLSAMENFSLRSCRYPKHAFYWYSRVFYQKIVLGLSLAIKDQVATLAVYVMQPSAWFICLPNLNLLCWFLGEIGRCYCLEIRDNKIRLIWVVMMQ